MPILRRARARARRRASPTAPVFPVVCGSADQRHRHRPPGRLHLRDRPVAPRPPAVTVDAGDTEVEVDARPGRDPLAFVFKTIADPYVGQHLAVQGAVGHGPPDDHLVNPRTGTDERLHGLFTLRGKEQEPVTEVPAGDIGAVAKLDRHHHRRHARAQGHAGLGRADHGPRAVLADRRSSPSTQADEDKLATALHRLQDEDPALASNATTRRTRRCCAGMGETHLAITLERLAAQVRRRRRHRGRARALPRDDHRRGRGRGQAQEAVRRPRPVRRGVHPRRADRARRRASSSSTRSSAARSPASSSPRCSTGEAFAIASLNPIEPAILKLISEQSTGWCLPSKHGDLHVDDGEAEHAAAAPSSRRRPSRPRG